MGKFIGAKRDEVNKPTKLLAIFGIIVVLVVVCFGGYFLVTYIQGLQIAPETTVRTTSTFELIANVHREDVSSFTEMDIWFAKSGATFENGMEDVTDLTTNFERVETNQDADDISIDLRDESYVWAEITGNTVFENTFYLLYGGVNRNYKLYPHYTSSLIDFNILLQGTMGTISVPDFQTNGNFTGILDCVHYNPTVAEMCYGDDWAMSTAEFNELSQKGKEIVWDEMNYRDQYPTYNPVLDISNNYDRAFERITNAPALKFTFNETISVVDGEATQINCTIGSGYPIECFISGADLYMAWYQGFDFTPNPYWFEYEMSFGENITLTTVISGRANIYGSLTTLAWDETYSTIGT